MNMTTYTHAHSLTKGTAFSPKKGTQYPAKTVQRAARD